VQNGIVESGLVRALFDQSYSASGRMMLLTRWKNLPSK
jgi:hypothetical protein